MRKPGAARGTQVALSTCLVQEVLATRLAPDSPPPSVISLPPLDTGWQHLKAGTHRFIVKHHPEDTFFS